MARLLEEYLSFISIYLRYVYKSIFVLSLIFGCHLWGMRDGGKGKFDEQLRISLYKAPVLAETSELSSSFEAENTTSSTSSTFPRYFNEDFNKNRSKVKKAKPKEDSQESQDSSISKEVEEEVESAVELSNATFPLDRLSSLSGTCNSLQKHYVEQGKLYFKERYYVRAIAFYEKSLQVKSDSEVRSHCLLAYFYLGNAYYQKKDYNRSAYYYKRVLVFEPNHVLAHNNLGLIHLKRIEVKRAQSYFERAIQIDPTYSGAYINLGNIFYELYDYNRAMENYERALEQNQRSIWAYYNLGLIYYNKGEYDKAIVHYKKILEFELDWVEVDYQLGLSEFAFASVFLDNQVFDKALRGYLEAINYYKAIFKRFSDRTELFYRMGVGFVLAGREDIPLFSLGKKSRLYLQLAEDYSRAYFELGKTYVGMGEYGKAMDTFEEVMELNIYYYDRIIEQMLLLAARNVAEAPVYFLLAEYFYNVKGDEVSAISYLEQGLQYETLETDFTRAYELLVKLSKSRAFEGRKPIKNQ